MLTLEKTSHNNRNRHAFGWRFFVVSGTISARHIKAVRTIVTNCFKDGAKKKHKPFILFFL